jgi:hypothetical protein
LLDMIVARLTTAGLLPPARALTVRELVQLARLADVADHQRLTELARTSERVRFSNSHVSNEDLAAAIEQGRELFTRLPAQAAAPQVGSRS